MISKAAAAETLKSVGAQLDGYCMMFENGTVATTPDTLDDLEGKNE